MEVATFHEILLALHRAQTPLTTFLREPGGHTEGCAWSSLLLALTLSVPCFSVLLLLLGVGSSKHILSKAPRDTTEMKARRKNHLLTYVVTMHVSRSVIYMYFLTYISGMGWPESLTVPAF